MSLKNFNLALKGVAGKLLDKTYATPCKTISGEERVSMFFTKNFGIVPSLGPNSKSRPPSISSSLFFCSVSHCKAYPALQLACSGPV
jgi:hypothetical protein